MILCPLCSRNILDVRIGKIIHSDNTVSLGVTEILCKNLGTGMLSRCRFQGGDPLFTEIAHLYETQVEFDRQYTDVRNRYDLDTQQSLAKINAIIFSMREDALIRAQQNGEGEFTPIAKNWSLDTKDKK